MVDPPAEITVESALEILFEDSELLVVNKPPGLATQAPREFDSLERRIRHYLAQQTGNPTVYLGIPHRLDRCVSGVVLFAKRLKGAQRISKQFERREVVKMYLAIVEGVVDADEGTWIDTIRKIPDRPLAEMVSESMQGGKEAILHFSVDGRAIDVTRLRIRLDTGRMHQIRLQCAAHGHPIRGDVDYGGTSVSTVAERVIGDSRDRAIDLQAFQLTVTHPRFRELMTFTAPPLARLSGPTWDRRHEGV